jgi:hypothetical protein
MDAIWVYSKRVQAKRTTELSVYGDESFRAVAPQAAKTSHALCEGARWDIDHWRTVAALLYQAKPMKAAADQI